MCRLNRRAMHPTSSIIGWFLSACLLAFCGSSASAQVIAYEGFDYAVGGVLAGNNGGVGWGDPWRNSPPGATIAGGSLAFGGLATTGNSALRPDAAHNTNSTNGDTRDLTTPVGTDNTSLFMSFLIRPSGPVGVGP